MFDFRYVFFLERFHLGGANHYLDLTPEGRNDGAYPNWPRRRDEYDQAAPPHG